MRAIAHTVCPVAELNFIHCLEITFVIKKKYAIKEKYLFEIINFFFKIDWSAVALSRDK